MLYAVVIVADFRAWYFIIAAVVLLLVFTLHASWTAPTEPEIEEAAGVEFADVPLEWVGIDRPFTPEDVQELDRQLGLVEVS